MSYIIDGRCRLAGTRMIRKVTQTYAGRLVRRKEHDVVRTATARVVCRHGGHEIAGMGELWDHGGYMMAVFHGVRHACQTCERLGVTRDSSMVVQVVVEVDDVVLEPPGKHYTPELRNALQGLYARQHCTEVAAFSVWDSRHGWRVPARAILEHVARHARWSSENVSWARRVAGLDTSQEADA